MLLLMSLHRLTLSIKEQHLPGCKHIVIIANHKALLPDLLTSSSELRALQYRLAISYRFPNCTTNNHLTVPQRPHKMRVIYTLALLLGLGSLVTTLPSRSSADPAPSMESQIQHSSSDASVLVPRKGGKGGKGCTSCASLSGASATWPERTIWIAGLAVGTAVFGHLAA